MRRIACNSLCVLRSIESFSRKSHLNLITPSFLRRLEDQKEIILEKLRALYDNHKNPIFLQANPYRLLV
jgi:hypothetical protein